MAAFSGVFVAVTASLIVQFVILALLFYGYRQYRRAAFRMHGAVMSWALFAHLAVVIAVMIPSFASVLRGYIIINPTSAVSIIGIIHGVLGAVALGLGIWFVASWRFHADVKKCFGKRKQMRATFAVWVTALSLGTALYVILYGAALTT